MWLTLSCILNAILIVCLIAVYDQKKRLKNRLDFFLDIDEREIREQRKKDNLEKKKLSLEFFNGIFEKELKVLEDSNKDVHVFFIKRDTYFDDDLCNNFFNPKGIYFEYKKFNHPITLICISTDYMKCLEQIKIEIKNTKKKNKDLMSLSSNYW